MKGEKCQRCASTRVASTTAKCSDMCGVYIGDREQHCYVPYGLGIGGGDYVEFAWCLDCGQIQGKFPLPQHELEGAVPTPTEETQCEECLWFKGRHHPTCHAFVRRS